MANEILRPSLNFLTDAAYLLATTAPEASAHLMTQRNALMFNNELAQSDVQRQHICGSCGHIMIPGKRTMLKFETQKTIRKAGNKKDKSRSAPRGTQKQLTCDMCGRFTKISLPPPAPIMRHAKPVFKPVSARTMVTASSSNRAANTSATASAPEPPKVSTNASSKKRAKSRKQGLQALLEQTSSAKAGTGLGLSLADFMKK